ncbi:MAG: FAD/NAD(P)-binding protein [Defluviitaleaceae bacterium]|nr:FAD/NAD(P)-binding protein [Defluviitaleaceae bacterium]
MCKPDSLIPLIGVITDIKTETPDVKTFTIVDKEGKKAFDHKSGQCAMISVPGVGEAMFSIASAPTNTKFMEFSIKACGVLTDYLHTLEAGQQVTIRGPYGNSFPNDLFKNKDMLFIAGGIGLAPVRSVINYVFDKRDDYGKVDILYGARSADDLVFKEEIMGTWTAKENTHVHLTIDRPQENWDGHVGFVPAYLGELNFKNDKTVIVCGPPIMIKFVLEELDKLGFKKEQIYTTLELRMKCGIGKCGRCNIGSKYVCKDGPVFRCDELDDMPEEY